MPSGAPGRRPPPRSGCRAPAGGRTRGARRLCPVPRPLSPARGRKPLGPRSSSPSVLPARGPSSAPTCTRRPPPLPLQMPGGGALLLASLLLAALSATLGSPVSADTRPPHRPLWETGSMAPEPAGRSAGAVCGSGVRGGGGLGGGGVLPASLLPVVDGPLGAGERGPTS